MAKKQKDDVDISTEVVSEVVMPQIKELFDKYHTIQSDLKNLSDSFAAKFVKLAKMVLEKNEREASDHATTELSEENQKTISQLGEYLSELKKIETQKLESIQQRQRPLVKISFSDQNFKVIMISFLAYVILGVITFAVYCYQRPEKWAALNYKAAIELGEENPGNAYDATMRNFYELGASAMKKDIRIRRKNGRKIVRQKKRYAELLLNCLSDVNENNSGIEVTKYLEREVQYGGKEVLIFFKYEIDGSAAIAHIDQKGNVYYSVDDSITSLQGLDKGKKAIQWISCGNIKKSNNPILHYNNLTNVSLY